MNLRKLETTYNSTLSILSIALVSDEYFMPYMDINSMLVLPKLPKWLKKIILKDVLVDIEEIVILDWNITFLNAIFSVNFEWKYFKNIEKYFIISKYCPISNSNVNTVITNMNSKESSSDYDRSNEVYNINNNSNRNNIVNNSRINDNENKNINISNSESNDIVKQLLM